MVRATSSPVGGPRGPIRTCVGCKKHDSRSVLIRVVAQDSVAMMDPVATAVGRGAWLHRDQQCLDLALRRRSLVRALRVPGLDTSHVEVTEA